MNGLLAVGYVVQTVTPGIGSDTEFIQRFSCNLNPENDWSEREVDGNHNFLDDVSMTGNGDELWSFVEVVNTSPANALVGGAATF